MPASTATGEPRKKTWVFFFIFFVLVLILVIYYFSEIKKEFIQLEKVNPFWLTIAISGQFITYFFSALIYRSLLQTLEVTNRPSLWETVKASIISLLFNQTVPSAGVSGNAFFLNFFSRYNISRQKILTLILAELMIFYAAMELIIILLFLSCLFIVHVPRVFRITLFAGIIVYLGFAVGIVFAGRNNALHKLFEKMMKWKFIKKFVGTKNKSPFFNPNSELKLSGMLGKNKPVVARTLIYQVLLVIADAFTLYALIIGMGNPLSPFYVLLVLMTTKIISIIPFLPGSLVLYESSMSFLFVQAGVPLGTAIFVTLAYRFLSFWLPMPVGTVFYRNWMRNSR